MLLAPAGVGLLVYEESAEHRRRGGAARALAAARRRALAAAGRAEVLLAALPGGSAGLLVRAGVLLLRRRAREEEAAAAAREAPGGEREVRFLNPEGVEAWLEPLLASEAWGPEARAAFARLWREEAEGESARRPVVAPAGAPGVEPVGADGPPTLAGGAEERERRQGREERLPVDAGSRATGG
ncbi:MAG: hypothetical protein IRZ26_05865 [Clostridia bacterium]|nr:hypothetical protein [Clostridia bacterium]